MSYQPKLGVLKKTKDINVKAFNMATKKMKLKPWQNIFHVILNANSILQHVIQIKNGITKHVNVNVQIIVSAKKIIVAIPVLVKITSIADTSVITSDEIISVMDIESTKMTNTIATKVTLS